MKRVAYERRKRRTGSVAIEFSLVAVLFFTVVFATLELARAEFLVNTLEEVTRRAASAAANVDFNDAIAMQNVRAHAVFRDASGPLVLGDPVTADNVKIDYLSVSKTTWDLTHMSTLPTCPVENRSNCLTDPNGASCIRFVRARICASVDDTGNCSRMPYRMVFPFLDLSKIKLPSAETIVPAGSLGATIGSVPCH